MTRRKTRVEFDGALYHVIVRGNQRRKTFRSDDDYKAYLERLEKYRAKFHVRIYPDGLRPLRCPSIFNLLRGRQRSDIFFSHIADGARWSGLNL
jgi:hypothetical protein